MECRLCHLKLKDAKAYKLHHKISHPSEPYTCICARTYPTVACFDAHFKSCDVKAMPSNASVHVPHSGNCNTVSVDHLDTNRNDDVMEFQSDSNEGDSHLYDHDLVSILKGKIDILVSNLYVKKKLPRQYVQEIICDVNAFATDILSSLKNALSSSMELSNKQNSVMDLVFSSFDNLFAPVSSEYKRFQYYKNSGDYIEPIPYEVGVVDVSVPTAEGPLIKTKKMFGQSIPIDKVLKKILELPDCFSSIVSYISSFDENSDTKENFVQCALWKSKRSKYPVSSIVLPLHIDYDDVECNNCLGSRPLKLGAVYVWIPCLPSECQSSVKNIFLALVFETWVRNFGDEIVFKPLISILRDLEEKGIIVNSADGPKQVYFVTGLLLGDNLGLNSVLGFVECFSANFFCRFCYSPKCATETQSVENLSLLRTEQSYNADLLLDDYTSTGVKKDSAFNALPSFHVTSNYSIDTFHDLAEGVAHYVMLNVLRTCIPQYFTLAVLNHRIDLFQHGPCDSNSIPIVSENFAEREKLKMSGSETLLFVKMFGLLVGDLVPHSEPIWKLYLKLLELLDGCLGTNCSKSYAVYLRILVKEFNEMYVSVTGDTLKPKFHFLVHYATIYEQSGPLMSSKRFESKHRDLLIPAHATESRRNICKTVAIHHQLEMCHRFKSNKSVLPEIEFGTIVMVEISDFSFYKFVSNLPESLLKEQFVLSTSWVNIKGSMYKPGMVLLLNLSESGSPVFGVIEMILLFDKDVIFVYSYLLTVGFDDHIHAYEVEVCDTWSNTTHNNLYDPLPLSLRHSVLGLKYVILRSAL